jgi:CheY-like chemotaxis protein
VSSRIGGFITFEKMLEINNKNWTVLMGRLSVLILLSPGRLRDGLCVLLCSNPFIEDVYLAEDGAEVVKRLGQNSPHIVLLDAGFFDREAWDVLDGIRQNQPHLRLVAVVHNVQQKERAQALEVDRVLWAGFSAEDLFNAITT